MSDISERKQVILENTFLALLIGGAFLIRLWGLSKAHDWDQNVYLQNATVICCGKTNYSELDSRPPLLSLIFALFFLVWNHVYVASVVTALINALGSLWLYLSGRIVAGRIAAAIAAFFLSFVPFFVTVPDGGTPGFISDDTGHSLLSDCPALSLLLLSFWLLLRALKRQTNLRFACAGFALSMAVLMRFGSLSSVGILSLLVLAANQRVRAICATAVGFVVGFGPYLCWSRWRYGGFLFTLESGWDNFQGPRESRLFYLKNYGHIFGWFSLVGLVLWAGQWAWQTWKQKQAPAQTQSQDPAETKTSRRLQAFLFLWGITVLIFFSNIRHSEPRYIMPLAPSLFLLSGIGFSMLLKKTSQHARIGGIILLAAGMILTVLPLRERLSPTFIDHTVTEEMTVSDFLNHAIPQGTGIYTNFNYPDFAYLTNFPITALPEGGPDLYQELGKLDDGSILIAYKQFDNGALPEPSFAWLDSNPHFQPFKDYPKLRLYKYRAATN